jgi:hypothetical protein
MSISSRAVALIVAKPLDPEKARRYTHMRFESRWNPPIRGVYGIKRNAEAWLGPVPAGADRWLDEHMWAFWTVAALCSCYAAWTVVRLVIGG